MHACMHVSIVCIGIVHMYLLLLAMLKKKKFPFDNDTIAIK